MPAPAVALPEWDLSDLYPAAKSPALAPALANDLDRAEREARDFAARYAGKLAALDGAALAASIADYERLQEILGRVMSFAQLRHATALNDPDVGRFYQSMRERVTDISTHLLFFMLELNRIDDSILDAKLSAPTLARYRPWLRDVRAMRPHQLSDELEKLLLEKDVTGRGAWNRLYDETLAALRFPLEGQSLTLAETLHRFQDQDETVRRAAAGAIGKILGEHSSIFTAITNVLAKDKEIEDRWRHFARPVSGRNLANLVEDEVVDALVNAVRESFPRLSHRYYALKARWLGKDQLDHWDRNAPLPGDKSVAIGWGEAVKTVLEAYDQFSPEMARIGRRFFDGRWIDAPPKPGKSSGAFSHPTVPSAHPYIMLNYQGTLRDVTTLAHELGHGVHQVLAAGQGLLMADTPLTLAETASVFGEMLTFRKLLNETRNPQQRRALLAGKVEDMINTVVRQVAFFEFERRVHEERRNGELLPEQFGEIWFAVQGESLGPSVRFDEGYRHYWSYISHFIHAPFYVYAYAFGDCLVNSLYAVYEGAHQGFAEKYLDALRAGGTLRHRELLAPFGLDATDPGFWQKGLGVIAGLIDQLEAMDKA
ncbi:MAG: M3 family oligoendopeptidase [Alphaproteobacteria bacterium]|nr:M3 family oligoendopeptidase [Alphaproteobacteria bacterium]